VTFQRSNSGLSSLYLFYEVESIVFVEGGGDTLSLESLIGGDSNTAGHDFKFWSHLFKRFLKRKRFKFRPVGSKSTLLQLASLISDGRVRNVLVCMDRDFDNYSGRLLHHPRILYTHGYSWENDAWSLQSSIAVFRKISHAVDDTEALAELKSAFAAFETKLRWIILSHALLVSNGLLSITNSQLEAVVLRGAGQMPVIRSSAMRELIRHARPRSPKPHVRFPHRMPFSVFDDCYGHLLSTYAFHTLAYLLRKHCNIRSFGKDVAASIAIDSSYASIMRRPRKRLHYQNQFNGVSASLSAAEPTGV